MATTIVAEVILLTQLSLSGHSGSADRQRIPERQRLLHRRGFLRRTATERTVNAIDMRRA